MDQFIILIVGCIGAWLLVAGPTYQAALELREEQLDHELFDAATTSVPKPPSINPWWWLLPPVGYLKNRSRTRIHREAIMDALGPEALKQSVNFLNKARGWFIVGAGGLLIAVKETWELSEHAEWPPAIFWILVVLLPIVCVFNVAWSLHASAKVLERDKDSAAQGGLAG
jgi:hypothetical protein